MKKGAILVSSMLVASTAIGVAQVRGVVVDKTTKEPLVGVSIYQSTAKDGKKAGENNQSQTSVGTITDLDGKFELQTGSGKQQIKVSYIGYTPMTLTVKNGETITIEMEPDVIALNDVVITSSVAVARKTPVAISTLDPIQIEEKLGSQEFPEILKSTPGVYATKQGGGYGDSKINMRGFKSENIAVMINGVPMNDMEWGGVYWSNWAGLSDVTRSMQTQRGLGAAKVAAPSVGGSINIITNTIEAKKGGAVSYAMGNDGYNKVLFNVSTGLSKSGWAMTLLGGKTWGDGYIQGTDFEGYNWFVNLTKRFNDEHQLSLTAFGAPQWHNQRNSKDGLTILGWQTVAKTYMNGDSPYKYNPSYGFGKNGERKTSARNEYNKPQISLNHLWQINDISSLSTALYTSIGRGAGYSGQGLTSADRNNWYGSSYGALNMTFRNPDGTFAYDQIYDLNEESIEGSRMVMSKSYNKHNWYGLVSTYTSKLGDYVDLYAGLDLRYYKGTHTNEIIDLYGGDYYVDSSSRKNVLLANNAAAAAGDAYINQKLQVGDVVYRDYDGYVMSEGVFAQAEYNRDKLSAFVAGSLSNTGYWRYDRFYYDAENAKSSTVNYLGWTAKGGINYNLTDNHNVFANIGYISRAPFFSGGAFLQATTSNMTNPDAVNEKIFSAELGYGFRSSFLTANVNLYHTKWMDKTMSRGIDLIVDEKFVDRLSLNMTGVNALHQGIELDFVAKPYAWLDIKGMFSIGNWRWNSNAKGYFYDSTSQPVQDWDTKTGQITIAEGIQTEDHASMSVNLKGVKVGGSAQTTSALGATFKISKSIRVGTDWTYFGRNYADWSFSSNDIVKNGEKNYSSPWRIPSASVVDMNASYRFKFGKVNATLSGNINNLFNQEYITDATDGDNHDWQTAYGIFYGFGRTYNVRLKLNF